MSEEPERRRGADEAMAVIVHRLDAIEKRQENAAKEQSRGFSDVRDQIAGLTFVRGDVYAADQRTADEVHATLRKDILDLSAEVDAGFGRLDRRVSWSHATIGVALLGGVVAAIARLAGLS
jgi:virulence-associated protein VapD